ncbi:hypothetical protein ACS15_5188 [Ralstonia insidiosa]|uniref:Uncharacterized protein n=1 Tax=Ralstonia insidiosa TaxID=190721 RepID=A0AAC9FSJ8_9RALS|nr:hypothetical protein ACS15_5188 [Ralstonia insidiosa]
MDRTDCAGNTPAARTPVTGRSQSLSCASMQVDCNTALT